MIRSTVSLLYYMENARRSGGSAFVEYPDGTREKVVMPW
jgi:hypothetical protein